VICRNDGATYRQLRDTFRWRIPESFNLGVVCADRHPRDLLALIDCDDSGDRTYTFGDLSDLSNRVANTLRAEGVRPGDRVGIILRQCVEAAITHLGVYKLGAIAVPMSCLFGPQALSYRLGDASVRVVVTDVAHAEGVHAADPDDVVRTLVVDGSTGTRHPQFWDLVYAASPHFTPAGTGPDSPALLIYTSGTTGAPKGALHGHRVLLGHVPGFQLSHDFFPVPGDRFWTPADWAWIGGLMDALMPSLYFGMPVVAAARDKFDPEWALDLVDRTEVRNMFMPPTALRLMRGVALPSSPRLPLRSVMCGGEPLGEETLQWAREQLGVTVNEIYGQTEVNYVVGNSYTVWEVRPGSMGRPYPGHDVCVLGEDEAQVPRGEIGQVAVNASDPVAFLGYWDNAEATHGKHSNDGAWILTGDLARQDEDDYLWFVSRNDDIINSGGYRIGPAEIEACLIRHPAVAMAAAVGVPHAVRGEIVKAFVQLHPGHRPSEGLADEIRRLVQQQLAAYEYPREIEFVDALPVTTTGKVRRSVLRARQPAQSDAMRYSS